MKKENLYYLKRNEELLKCVEKVLAIDLKDIDALKIKAEKLFYLKRHDESLACAEKVLVIDTENTFALSVNN